MHQFESHAFCASARRNTKRGILPEEIEQIDHGEQCGLQPDDFHSDPRGGTHTLSHAAGILRPAPIGNVLQHVESADDFAFFVEQRRGIADHRHPLAVRPLDHQLFTELREARLD